MQPESRKAAKAITVINLKGGVGKTHTAWLIASVCQERSLRILAVDTDAQANLTNSFLPERDGKPGIEDLFNPAADARAQALVRPTSYAHIDILPSGPGLAHFDYTDPRQWERTDLHLALREGIRDLRHAYDFIVFDCPPRLSVVSYAALYASDYVIIPLEAADWGAQGIIQVTGAIHQVQQRYHPTLVLLGYLVSRFKRTRSYQQSYLQQLREHFGDQAFDSVLPDLAQFEKAVTDAIPLTIHSPRSEAASIARGFFDEILRRIERHPGGGDRDGEAALRSAADAAKRSAVARAGRARRSPATRRRLHDRTSAHPA
jgi:chromosome partitioning protein